MLAIYGCDLAAKSSTQAENEGLVEKEEIIPKIAIPSETSTMASEPKKETKEAPEKIAPTNPETEGQKAASEKESVLKNTVSKAETINVDNDNLLILVNKKHRLPSTYVPPDLVTVKVPFPFSEDLPSKKMRKEAALALEKLFSAAQAEGLSLYAQSGYRSYATQEAIFKRNAQKYGEQKANTFSARAGESEHQTGLAMDVTSPSIGYALEESFAQTKEGKWLAENAAQFGFIIRYPLSKEEITGYTYEPWHIRYVGKAVAREIGEKGITLEEYLNQE